MTNYDLAFELYVSLFGKEAGDAFTLKRGWKSFPFHTASMWKRLGFKVKPNMTPLKLKQWIRTKGKCPTERPKFISKYVDVYLDTQVEKIEGSR